MGVVLDMDETLIHSVFLSDLERLLRKKLKAETLVRDENEISSILKEYRRKADFCIEKSGGIAVNLRPGIHTFLRKLSTSFEVVLFTAADREYADAILRELDPESIMFPYKLYREHTIMYKGTKYVKDLSLLGRDLSRTVLIDNSILTMRACPNNCVLIDDFYGDRDDQELEIMWSILTELDQLDDVRPCLAHSFSLSEKIENILANPNS